jgi:phage shock protein A
MGIFSRMKRAIKSKANATVSKAIDPAKELEMTIFELEEQRKLAYKELLGFKATAKKMEQEIERVQARIADFEKKAVVAVNAGDDELAKQCLREKNLAAAELDNIKRDRDEAIGCAIELNKSRKAVETKLQILKLRKGTMASQLAAARTGKDVVFGDSKELFERLDEAGDRIDHDAVMAEVNAAMGAEETGSDLESKILAADTEGTGAEDALGELKAKMQEAKERKLIPGS